MPIRPLAVLATVALLAGCGGSGGGGNGGDPQPPAPTPVATIDVDAALVGKPVSQRLFGTNIEANVEWHGLWDDAHDRMSPAHVAGAVGAGIGMIRFPGGGYAATYHWRAGVGPRAARPLGVSPFNGDLYRNPIGTDEILGLCATLGGEPIFQVDIADARPAQPATADHAAAPAVAAGTPEEAADWVRYCNASGRRVRYWEMGNEQWIAGFENMAPTEYVRRYRLFAAAMRAADPGIRIGAVLMRNFGAYRFGVDPMWDQTVLSQLGSDIDFVAVHDAYAPVVPLSPAGADFWQVYRATLGFPRQVERNLADISDELATWAGDRAGRIEVAVTEWGPLFDLLRPGAVWMDHCKTLGSAVMMASMMNTFLRDARVGMSHQFKFSDPVFMGLVGYDGGLKAELAAMQLYGRHHGAHVVPTAVASPTYDAVAVGVVAAESGIPTIDAAATLSQDGATLFLHVVNRDLDADLATRFRIAGFTPVADAVRWEIAGRAVDANNGNDLAPGPLVYPVAITAPTGSAFAAGAPGTIAVRRSDLRGAGADFVCVLPRLSATVIELRRDAAAPRAIAAAR